MPTPPPITPTQPTTVNALTLPAGVARARPPSATELRRLLRHDIGCLRGFRRAGARWAAAPPPRRIERQIRRTGTCYRGARAREADADPPPPSLAAARRQVCDALGRLQAVRVGRLTGRAFRIAAAEVGLDTARAAYRAAQRRVRG